MWIKEEQWDGARIWCGLVKRTGYLNQIPEFPASL
jgi:hypothetical protein